MIKSVTAEHKQRIEAQKTETAERQKMGRKRSVRTTAIIFAALVLTSVASFIFVANGGLNNPVGVLILFVGVFCVLGSVLSGMILSFELFDKSLDFSWVDENELKQKILEEEFNFTFCSNQGGSGFSTPRKYLVQTPDGEYMDAVVTFTDTQMECVIMSKQQESVTEL